MSLDFSQFDRGVFLLNVHGIVYDKNTKQILIGRRENDAYLKELAWCFPGGRPAYKNELEYYLLLEIKKKTSLDVKIKNVIFAKTYPEKREFLSIYYLCDYVAGKAKAGEKFVEVKWVEPTKVTEYFTTSLHPKLFEYLKTLSQ